ncbi:hypothetical protein JKF63_05476 [Porcisia hertigi]|uniref:Uncharacterized protein n=1 Tax=Porcisia hertigi TaxID=2761500 RepID=A0A836LGL4_9TRYP|nr:hypothetical protein JKF63_05476 [Porcisia hertigi]
MLILLFLVLSFPSLFRSSPHPFLPLQAKPTEFAMSFSTKLSMWWGSVTAKTEQLFNKEKQRLVTHEYYDNPNPRTTRPKSLHSIRGSMRTAESARSSQHSNSDGNSSKSSRWQQEDQIEDDITAVGK